MQNAFSSPVDKTNRNLLAQGSQLVRWWWRSLKSCFPFAGASKLPSVETTIVYGKSVDAENSHVSSVLSDKLLAKALLAAANGADSIAIDLAADCYFQRELRLPNLSTTSIYELAAGSELTTPFSREEVVRAYAIRPDEAGDETQLVNEYIAKRDTIERILRICGESGIVLKRLGVDDGEGLRTDFLEDPSVQLRQTIPVLGWVTALLVVAFGLSAFFGWSLYQDRRISALQAEISSIEDEAVAIRKELSRVEEGRARVEALALKRSQSANLLNVLLLATQAIDDETYLTNFEVRGQTVEISGLSTDSAAVFEALDDVESFRDIRFASPTRSDAASERERFSISFSALEEPRG